MIRYLENNEKQNIRPLYEHCFDDTKEYTDYYFQNRLPGNHVIVNERDNKMWIVFILSQRQLYLEN